MRIHQVTSEEVSKLFEYNEGQLIRKSQMGNYHIGSIAGTIDEQGYIQTKISRKPYRVHRLIWILHNGEIPDGKIIDHINHIRDDNRIENLRLVTHKENARNLAYRDKPLGVYYAKDRNKWRAQITVDSKCIVIGSFDTMEEAVIARKEVEVKYNFHPNHGKDIK